MSFFDLFSALLVAAALLGIINTVFLRLPTTIGIMALSLLLSVVLLLADPVIPWFSVRALSDMLITRIDFSNILLNCVLSFLLFAGSLHVNLSALWQQRVRVALLAVPGTMIAVALLSVVGWYFFPVFGIHIPFAWCVVLGAILAPTDPVSVINMLHRLGLSERIQAIFAGESLFNDGVAVVIFGVALGVAVNPQMDIHTLPILSHFLYELLGSALLGLVTGMLAIGLMHFIRQDTGLELLISLALACGTFAVANDWHMSGPIAVVVAGLLMGESLRKHAAGSHHSEVAIFWGLMDEVLNALLFLVIGLEVLAISLDHHNSVLIAAICVAFAVLARAISVFAVSWPFIRKDGQQAISLTAILVWGGLRGGISLAMALVLPAGDTRAVFLPICYAVVAFTTFVQGLTMPAVIRYFHSDSA